MKKILIMVFSIMVLASLGSWVPANAQKDKTDKNTTTATTGKTMTVRGTVSSDGKMFISEKDNKSWKIDNPEEVKAHEGQHVSVAANEDPSSDTIHVNSVKMLGKSKGGTPPNSK